MLSLTDFMAVQSNLSMAINTLVIAQNQLINRESSVEALEQRQQTHHSSQQSGPEPFPENHCCQDGGSSAGEPAQKPPQTGHDLRNSPNIEMVNHTIAFIPVLEPELAAELDLPGVAQKVDHRVLNEPELSRLIGAPPSIGLLGKAFRSEMIRIQKVGPSSGDQLTNAIIQETKKYRNGENQKQMGKIKGSQTLLASSVSRCDQQLQDCKSSSPQDEQGSSTKPIDQPNTMVKNVSVAVSCSPQEEEENDFQTSPPSSQSRHSKIGTFKRKGFVRAVEKATPGQLSQSIYFCVTCGKQFRKLCNVKDHVRIHQGSMRFNCKSCGQKFVQRGNRDQHQKRNNCQVVYLNDQSKN